MPSHFLEVGRRFRRELSDAPRSRDSPRMSPDRRIKCFERDDLLAALDQSFGKQKSGRQIEVVARRAHGDAERIVADANFQGLFRREIVLFAAELPVVPFGNLRQIHAAVFASQEALVSEGPISNSDVQVADSVWIQSGKRSTDRCLKPDLARPEGVGTGQGALLGVRCTTGNLFFAALEALARQHDSRRGSRISCFELSGR